MPFAVVVDGAVVGTTSYWYPDPVRRQIEIGSTWLARAWWGSGLNGEVKRLLVGYAFTGLDCDKVVFRTDPANTRSQRALERHGAVRDGLVRRDWPRPDGTWRDSVYYSVLTSEWIAGGPYRDHTTGSTKRPPELTPVAIPAQVHFAFGFSLVA
jgi:RimJ/RimL family protein N-acetyltransferase